MSEKIRILNIITRLDIGGSSDVAIAIAERFKNDDYECILMYGQTSDPDGSISKYIENKKITGVNIKSLVRELNPVKDVVVFFKIYRYIKANKFDIVHTHSSKAGILGRWAAYFAGVKHIIHMPHGHVFYGYYGRFVSRMFVAAEKITALITDKIVAITPKGIKDHLDYKIAPEQKFVAVYPGVNVRNYINLNASAAEKKKELGIEEGSYIVGTVTRLEKVKNNAMLIKAFAIAAEKNPKAVLIVAGDGSEKEMLLKLAGELGVKERIKFLGFRKDIPELMNIFDVFALASLNEGFGKVFIQAGALVKPVVATRVGGVESVVLDGRTGLLVEPGDYKAFGGRILEVMESRDLADTLGRNAKEWVAGTENGFLRFSEEAMLNKFENLYKEVLTR